MIANILSLLIIDIEARRSFQNQNENTTLQCVGNGLLSTSSDYRWMIVPCVFYSMSFGLLSFGIIQLIAAQSPYSMRGLIMGATYGLIFLTFAECAAISAPFLQNLSVWGTGIISCGFWHSLMLLAIEGIAVVLLVQKYKGRRYDRKHVTDHTPRASLCKSIQRCVFSGFLCCQRYFGRWLCPAGRKQTVGNDSPEGTRFDSDF